MVHFMYTMFLFMYILSLFWFHQKAEIDWLSIRFLKFKNNDWKATIDAKMFKIGTAIMRYEPEK